jgi:hypothetical protein
MRKQPIILVGYRGNMGVRYAAILDSLGHPWYGIEQGGLTYCGTTKVYISELPACVNFHSMIIATSTMSHMAVIKKYRNLNIPMLVEKPICKEEPSIQWLVDNDVPVSMVNQYQYLIGEGDGETYYDYFKTGTDGLKWDCISIIALATRKPKINNKSPIWTCRINGQDLKLSDMDGAYMEMIENWIENPEPNLEYIQLAHKRLHEGYYEESSDRDPSPVNVKPSTRKVSHDSGKKDNDRKSSVDMSESGGVHREEKPKRSRRSRATGAKG